jgi:mannose-6-phosphate isomerase-like protein (cupin superfamily)
VSDGYRILSLDEIEPVPHRGSNLLPLRHALGFRPAGVNAWAADAGGQLVPPHEEDSGNEELYVVVRGRARFTVGDESRDVPAGTLLFVPPRVYRTAAAEEDRTLVLAVGGSVGKPFESHRWDSYAVADFYRQTGRLDEGRAVVRKMLEDLPRAWYVPYNAACWEALAGSTDAAFDHLRSAVDLNPEEARGYMANDADLDPLRDDPRFAQLLA